MRFLRYLQEHYVDTILTHRQPCNIYVEPSHKELTKEIEGEYARFFIVGDKLYVWDAQLATHRDVATKLRADKNALLFGGLGKVLQGRIYYDPKDWASDLFFKEDVPPDKVIDVLKKNKHHFYNYEEMVNYYLTMKPVK